MTIQYSNYQNDLFAKVEEQTGNVMVNAVAGSGKTFSLLECMRRSKGDSIFVAFNKSIATELATKVPSHVTAQTLHSFGLAAIRKSFGFVRVPERGSSKLGFIMQKYPATSFMPSMSGKEKAEIFQIRKQITDLISIWKATLIDWNNNEEVAKTASYYGINYDPANLGAARSIMQKSIDTRNFVDFDDMIYMPVALGLKVPSFSNVFVDECQDLNRSQIELVLKMVKKPNGRVIAVGDPCQSIYGFRGADTDAMNRIQEALQATVMPLSVCYRCPTTHLDLAREIVPHVEAAPNAIKGEIENISTELFTTKVDKEKEPLVLCRTNAPLISYAIKLIKEGKKAHVRGADIGSFLKGLVIGFGAKNLGEFAEKVDMWENAQLELLEKRRATSSVKDTICDYADVMRAFADQCASPYDITAMIDRIFSDDTDGTVFSSVHKAKGLEADTVYIIRPEQLPLVRKGQQEWEIQQEMNLKYVALTRSKRRLVFVGA
jgi:DNA helicase-2/ATP-dependent DNA helicase PcrA